MKKFFKVLSCSLLVLNLGLIAHAADLNQSPQIRDRKEIAPYLTVIDKINKELNSSISIPDDETLTNAGFLKEDVYTNITSQPLDKFEAELRKEVEKLNNKDVKLEKNNVTDKNSENAGIRVDVPFSNDSTSNKSSDVVKPMSVVSEIIQKSWLPDGFGAVDLMSEIMSVSGTAGTFFYNRIISAGFYTFTDRTHFRTTSVPIPSLSDSNRVCTVVYKGALFTGQGVMLTGAKTYTMTYNANS